MSSATSDVERRLALVELLTRKEPADALRRHRVVLPGDPDRHKQVLRLAVAYVQMKLMEVRERDTLP